MLQAKLDRMGIGFPKAENGEDIEILKQFFVPEDAEMFLKMEDRFQTPAEFAGTFGAEENVIAQRLEEMAQRGLIFRTKRRDITYYRPMPMIHGIYEANGHRLDQALSKKLARYFGKYLFKSWNLSGTPIFRTIPLNKDLVPHSEVMPYDDAEEIIRRAHKIALTNCACREMMERNGKRACSFPLDTCLMLNEAADYYVENGTGQYITKEKALAGLKRNEKEGLVVNVSNSKNPEVMCSCCPCCCGVNVSAKYYMGPSRQVQGNYICAVDEAKCTGCGICVSRCAFDANKLVDGKLILNRDNCFGCGLCVSTCAAEARSLHRKSAAEHYVPPNTLFEAYERMAEKMAAGRS